MERDTPVVENGPIEGASNSQGTQKPLPEENNCSQLEDDRLIARARAVGVDYEFAKPGVVETEDDRRKRKRRNQRRISKQEKRLREVVGEEKLQLAAPQWISTLHDRKMKTVLGTTLHLRTVMFLL